MYRFRLHIRCEIVLFVLLALLAQVACLPKKINVGQLKHVVEICHEDLKWKRFVEATRCYLPERRRAFQKWFRGGAEDIYIDSIEVHELELMTQTLPYRAKVVVALKSYRLPNTTLKTTTITENWSLLEGQWFLSSVTPDVFDLQGDSEDLDPSAEEK